VVSFSNHVGQSAGEDSRPVSTEFGINDLEATNQIHDIAARIGSASRLAKMSAAAKWARLINAAPGRCRVEHGTGTVSAARDKRPPRGTKSTTCNERLAAREVRHFSRQQKLTAFRPQSARARDRPIREFPINRTHLRLGFLLQNRIWIARRHLS
jgi:hypothetical protein